jgi:myosin-crossreactive antigen
VRAGAEGPTSRLDPRQSHVYLVGSGIASLASAVYLEPGLGAGRVVRLQRRFVSNAQARLLRGGKKLDSSFGLSKRQQMRLLELTFVPEKALGDRRIEDWFDHDFFTTNF